MVKVHVVETSVQSTLNRITDVYLDEEEKQSLILEDLDNLVRKLEPGARFANGSLYPRLYKITDAYLDNEKKQSTISTSLDGLINTLFPKSELEEEAYDPEIARGIREKAGYSQEILSEKLGLSKMAVHVYESNENLKYNPNSVPLVKYLIWLSEKGYDPFNIAVQSIPIITKISKKNAKLDLEKARRLREKAKVTQEELAQKIDAASAARVSSYEHGNLPKNPLISMQFVKYLIWLSELGYNPYGIKYEYKK
jgi:transcriptional regulator with XRE-family HTH domain